ncbi:MAG: PEP-CTERM sorting domain-containing protein [Rhizonema sp. PD37]|nr:PEP-CTERM sorting domain-containing protein [Rhizonema sp. PD37]
MTKFQVRKKLRKVCTETKSITKTLIRQTNVNQGSLRTNIRRASLGLATVTVLGLTTSQAASAVAVRTGFNTNTLPANDDGSTGLVNTGFTTNFFGVSRNQLYVNNNGNVTFDQPLSTFTPFGLTNTQRQIIAPFFADVDTRGSASQPVTYGTGTVDGRNAFGVNWVNVGYYPSASDKLNSFQLVLVDRSDTGAGNFDIEYNYDRIQWETGSASSGSNGLGGSSARVGYSNGTGAPGTFFELPGSAVNGALLDGGSNSLVSSRLNSNVNGRYIFTARNGSVSNQPVPEPLTILGSLAASSFGIGLRRKYKQQQKDTANV